MRRLLTLLVGPSSRTTGRTLISVWGYIYILVGPAKKSPSDIVMSVNYPAVSSEYPRVFTQIALC